MTPVYSQGDLFESRSDVISECGKYRYELTIVWDFDMPRCNVIGLNPSTATKFRDDATMRRVKWFARKLGYGGVVMTNLFGFRATNPMELKSCPDPVGPHNDVHINNAAGACDAVVCAWGNGGRFMKRAAAVVPAIAECTTLLCFGQNQNGSPKHPLYLPNSACLVNYEL